MTDEKPTGRRIWRIVLAGLLLALAGTAAWLGSLYQSSQRTAAAIARIEQLGGRLRYEHHYDQQGRYRVKRPVPGPEWLREIVGDEAFFKVRRVTLYRADLNGNDLANLLDLPGLRELDLGQTSVTDTSLGYVGQLTELRELSLSDTQISGPGLEHLIGLNQLESLFLERTKVGNAGLVFLGKLPRLRRLTLNSTPVSDAGLKHLAGLTRLEDLFLAGTSVTDEGALQLAKLKGLQGLALSGTAITDATLTRLKSLEHLESLYVQRTNVTLPAVKAFVGERPDVTVALY